MTPPSEVPFGLRNRLANTLADLPDEHRAKICASVQDYQSDLEAIGSDRRSTARTAAHQEAFSERLCGNSSSVSACSHSLQSASR